MRKWCMGGVAALCLAVAGCSSDDNAIFRTVSLDDGEQTADGLMAEAGPSIVLDAKQRIVTNTRGPDGRRIVCAEPNPDVAQGISRAFAAALSAQSGQGASGDASFSSSSATAVAQLGERLATIQLLRDELAALCRAYANGAVSQTHYTLRLSKLDDKMVTLLMGEMAAGAFGRPLATLGGGAGAGFSGGASDEEIATLRQEVSTRESEVAAAEDRLFSARAAVAEAEAAQPRDEALVSQRRREQDDRQRDLDRRDAQLGDVRNALHRAELRFANSAADAAATRGVGALNGRSPDAEVASEIGRLQQAYLDADDLTTLLNACIAALDERDPTIEKKRAELLESIVELTAASARRAEDVAAAEQEWRLTLDQAEATSDPTRKTALLGEADAIAATYFAKKTASDGMKAELALAEQKLDALNKADEPTELGKICSNTDLIRGIMDALIAQGVRSSQLRLLLAEQEQSSLAIEAAEVNRRAAELNACSAYLASPVALPSPEGVDDPVRRQMAERLAQDAAQARLRCLELINGG